MSFLKKIFGSKNKENKTKEEAFKPIEETEKNSFFEELLEEVLNGLEHGDKGRDTLDEVNVSFKKEYGETLEFLVEGEDVFSNWLKKEKFSNQDLEDLSDVITEIITALVKGNSFEKLILSFILAHNKLETYLLSLEILPSDKIETNSKKNEKLLDGIENKKKEEAEQDVPLVDLQEVGKITITDLGEDEMQFKKEFDSIVPLYFSKPEMAGKDFGIKDNNETPILLHKAFSEEFGHWKQIDNPWDKRSLFMSIGDKIFWNNLDLWQLMERMTIDRRPHIALDLSEQNVNEEQQLKADYWYALGHAQFNMEMYADAESNLKMCLGLEPTHLKAKTVLADVLHCTNRQKEAHSLYNEILKTKGLKEGKLEVGQLIAKNGLLGSPIYACAILESEKVKSDIWGKYALDYYYSPHYRMRHGITLLPEGNRKTIDGFVKILSLSREMPWFKEGVINMYNFINENMLPNVTDSKGMDEEKKRLASIIEKNKWELKGEGMKTTKIKLG